MSSIKPVLHDTHLKTALKHAPDADAQPSSNIRIEVLNYANQAVKPRKTWLQALKQWLLKDHFANAQWAGLTGVAAILLVSVLLSREHPEEVVWITAAPQPTPENSPATSAEPINHPENNTPAPASASVAIDATSEVRTNQGENTVSLNKSASATPKAEAKKHTLTTEQDALSKETQSAQAPFAAAPVTVSQPAEAQLESKGETQDAALQQVPMAQADAQALPAHLPEAESTEPSHKKIATINDTKTAQLEKNKSKLKAAQSTHSNLSGVGSEIQNLLNEITQQGGTQVATRDIAAGKLRVLQLKLEGPAQANHSIPCQLISQHQVAIDAITGYTQEQITLCTISPELNQAVEDYNQTMKNWQVQHAN